MLKRALALLFLLMGTAPALPAQNAVQIPTASPLPGLTLITDTNAAISTLGTLSSGASAPTASGLGLSALSGWLWHDTGTNTLWLRDQADANWIKLGTLDETNKLFTPYRALVPANNLSDLASVSTTLTNLGIGSAGLLAADTDGTLAANSNSRVPTQAAVKTYVAANVGGGGAPGAFSGLKIQVTSSTAVSVSASYVSMVNSSGAVITKALAATLATGTSGAINGLDTGTLAAATWYYVWAVSNGTTTGAVLSLSSTAPAAAITGTYPYYARIGAVRTASGSAALLGTIQYGRRVQYVVGGANLTALPTIVSGAQGTYSLTAPTFVTASISSVVPPTATRIMGVATNCSNGTTYGVYVAPNTSYSGVQSSNPAPLYLNSGYFQAAQFEFGLEGTTIAVASGGAGFLCQGLGWEDNL